MELYLILGVIVFLLFYCVRIYNRLIELRNNFQNSFAQIDVQLKRRHDLIPNLVETAKKFMSHERETLEAVIQARNNASRKQKEYEERPGRKNMEELLGMESILTGSLGKLFALSENYPDLKSDQTMLELMEELRTTENRISYARQAMNDASTYFNSAREIFPNIVIANLFGFERTCLWKIQEERERETPKVSF